MPSASEFESEQPTQPGATVPTGESTALTTQSENRAFVVTDAGLEVVRNMASRGYGVDSISNAIGVAPRTLRKIRKRQIEVQDALDVGHGVLENEIVDLLLEQGRKGNTTALIWLSKNRLGWRDKPADEAPQVAIQIGSQLTTGEMRARLDELLDERARIIETKGEER